MTRYTMQATRSTPHMDFDPDTHIHEIKGESYPENCFRFYGPMFEWLQEYLLLARGKHVELNMEIVYFNSSSSKAFMDLFDLLEEAALQGTDVVVNWRYHEENETALECGEEFMEDVEKLRFNLVGFS